MDEERIMKELLLNGVVVGEVEQTGDFEKDAAVCLSIGRLWSGMIL
jgi:hypothetical protein